MDLHVSCPNSPALGTQQGGFCPALHQSCFTPCINGARWQVGGCGVCVVRRSRKARGYFFFPTKLSKGHWGPLMFACCRSTCFGAEAAEASSGICGFGHVGNSVVKVPKYSGVQKSPCSVPYQGIIHSCEQSDKGKNRFIKWVVWQLNSCFVKGTGRNNSKRC